MAGHSKWKQIKRQKAVVDQRRGAQFTKLGREITMAARVGGGDPAGNARLRLAILKAKEGNMPADIVDRAINKAVGEQDASQLDDVLYEGYGPGGTAVMVEAVTDNRNRTVAEIRTAFSRGGGSMGESGSVGWMFSTRGVITITLEQDMDSDEIELQAIEFGADDILLEEDQLSIYTKPEDLETVNKALTEAGYKPTSAEVARVPSTTVPLEQKDGLQTLKLLDRLEDLDDVQRVFSNAEFSDEVLAAYEG
jgi:YebC/PmpR family DNA-binding regulatory protein